MSQIQNPFSNEENPPDSDSDYNNPNISQSSYIGLQNADGFSFLSPSPQNESGSEGKSFEISFDDLIQSSKESSLSE